MANPNTREVDGIGTGNGRMCASSGCVGAQTLKVAHMIASARGIVGAAIVQQIFMKRLTR